MSFVAICVSPSCLFVVFKQKTAYEMRISDWSSDVCSSDLLFGCETRIFDPSTLPLPDQVANDDHPAVRELRALSLWSEGQVWYSPERHGQISGIMKSQIDHLPLALGGIRPPTGSSLDVTQLSAGSQVFNSVQTLRLLGR